MKLFHGSDTVVRGPLANVGRTKVDFGQGFYLTKLRRQAESWAKTIASRGRNRKAFLNDNVIDTVEDYENGRITAEQALGLLAHKKVNHQICIRMQEVIDTYLRHIESVELKGA
jgi:hypothetical protein